MSHDDFCASIMEYVGGDPSPYGRSYEDIDEDEDRIREMEYYRSSDIPYRRYTIDGKATDAGSWSY